MSYSINKSTVESYKIRHETGLYWADINIDAQDKKGRIQIASDFGNWQNFWGACGCSFKSFLIQLNIEYAADKFGADRYFDLNKTLNSYRQAIIENRKLDFTDAKNARKVFDECKEMEDFNQENEFVAEMWNKKELMKFFDHSPELYYDITPGFKKFWKQVWPIFITTLKDELNIQQTVQVSDTTMSHP